MTIQFFQILLRHSYFRSGLFASCRIAPDGGTGDFLRRYSLVARAGPGEIGLYSGAVQHSPAATLAYLQQRLEGAPLRFLLWASESEFVQITDVPFDYAGPVALSTRKAGAPGAGGAPSELAPVFGPRRANQPGVIGEIEVYLDDCIALGGQNVAYQASFFARPLHWLYYVINRGQRKLHRPLICNQQQMMFDAPLTVLLPDGETALSFSSGSMRFPLQEAPATTFDLIDKLKPSPHAGAQEFERCLIKGLPTPTGRNLKARQIDGSLHASGEMYVYL